MAYTVEDVLAYMDIPLPEEDDLSEDEVEGYIDEMVDNGGNGNSDVGEGNDEQDGDNDGGEGNDGQEDDNGDPTIPEYTEHPGCTSDMTEKSLQDLFQLFVTDDMLEVITEQTKLFAQQYINSHELAQQSRVQQRVRSAHVHDVAELKKFLAMVMIMGLISYPYIEDYWVTSWPFATPTFSSILSRDRFSLMKFLHLNDSTKYVPKGQPDYDPLYKLQLLVDPLLANFKAAYILGRELSVNEEMIGFKGRLWLLQYLPKQV